MTLTGLFSSVLNMSMTAIVVIVAVSLARLPLSKAPKAITCGLWFVALFRLLCPISFESAISLFSLRNGLGRKILPYYSAVTSPVASPAVIDAGAAAAAPAVPVPAAAASDPLQTLAAVLACIWVAVAAGLVVYGVISYLMLKRRIATATLVDGIIYESDRISSAFVCGLLRPRIYLPSGLAGGERAFIIAHEEAHISRRDYLVKPLWFFAVCLHWFNPLVWLAFYFVGRDIEMRCDEAVIRQMGDGVKADYSAALLSLSAPGMFFAGSPLAFGESCVAARIKKVLNFRKPVTWIVLVALASAVTLTVVLAANPKEPEAARTLAAQLLEYKTDYVGDNSKVGGIIALLDYPGKGGQYQGFELQTAREPYGITIQFTAGSDAKELFSTETNRVWYQRDAALLLSLVGNADDVSFSLSDGDDVSPLVITYTRDDINALYGPDVRVHAKDEDTLNAFIQQIDIQASATISAAEASSIAASSPPSTVPGAGTSETSYGFVKYGPDGVVLSMSPLYVDDRQLAEDIITNAMLKSAAAPAVDLSSLDEYYKITSSGSDGSMSEYDVFLRDGRAFLQTRGQYSAVDDALYARLKAVMDAAQLSAEVENNLEAIMSSPMTSSNQNDYIAAHQKEYQTILKMGEGALNYMLSCFEKGEGDTLKGYIMMALCNDLLGAKSNLAGQSLPPSEWYRQLNVAVETTLPDYVYTGGDPITKLVYETETAKYQGHEGGFTVVAIHEFGRYEEGDTLKVIVTTYATSYHLYGKKLESYGGSIVPAAITYMKNADGTYSLSDYKQAEDGIYNSSSIKGFCIMPVSGKTIPGLADQVLNYSGNWNDLIELQKTNVEALLRQNNITDVEVPSA